MHATSFSSVLFRTRFNLSSFFLCISCSASVSAEAMRLLPGYRFLPTELELIRCYLLNKVTGNPIPSLDNHVMNPVIECDLYGDPTIWMNIFEETG